MFFSILILSDFMKIEFDFKGSHKNFNEERSKRKKVLLRNICR